MAFLRIPPEAQSDLALIGSISDDAVAELVSAIENKDQKFGSEDFASKIAAKLKKVSAREAERILEGLTALYYLIATTDDRGTKEVVQDVVTALRKSENADVQSNVKNFNIFEERLNRLLGARSFEIAAKAFDILTDHEHVYVDARILTDLRPVFGHNIEHPPAAAVVVHNLKLKFLDGSQQKEFFLALDFEDVNSLIGILQRAQKKDGALRKLLAQLKLPHIVPNE